MLAIPPTPRPTRRLWTGWDDLRVGGGRQRVTTPWSVGFVELRNPEYLPDRQLFFEQVHHYFGVVDWRSAGLQNVEMDTWYMVYAYVLESPERYAKMVQQLKCNVALWGSQRAA
jgi:hypothetical protein